MNKAKYILLLFIFTPFISFASVNIEELHEEIPSWNIVDIDDYQIPSNQFTNGSNILGVFTQGNDDYPKIIISKEDFIKNLKNAQNINEYQNILESLSLREDGVELIEYLYEDERDIFHQALRSSEQEIVNLSAFFLKSEENLSVSMLINTQIDNEQNKKDFIKVVHALDVEHNSHVLPVGAISKETVVAFIQGLILVLISTISLGIMSRKKKGDTKNKEQNAVPQSEKKSSKKKSGGIFNRLVSSLLKNMPILGSVFILLTLVFGKDEVVDSLGWISTLIVVSVMTMVLGYIKLKQLVFSIGYRRILYVGVGVSALVSFWCFSRIFWIDSFWQILMSLAVGAALSTFIGLIGHWITQGFRQEKSK